MNKRNTFNSNFAAMAETLSIIDFAKQTIQNEVQALQKMATFVNAEFETAVNLLHQSAGRVVLTGIGKSAIIAQKIAATMNSTGTPALFMHAADAIHGDLGMIRPEDVVIIISKSGESPEIKALVPFVKHFGNPVIAICGNVHSYLATHADYCINTTVDKEACPNNLAPTTSTTAQLVMGDAIAVCLLQLKGFTARDFARFHPGGALGKQLYLTAGELSHRNMKPSVDINADLKEVILVISENRLGATAVLEAGQLIGIITDGDLRRMLEKEPAERTLNAGKICTRNPLTLEEEVLAIKALEMMQAHNITQLITTKAGNYTGMVHLHDLIREGLL